MENKPCQSNIVPYVIRNTTVQEMQGMVYLSIKQPNALKISTRVSVANGAKKQTKGKVTLNQV